MISETHHEKDFLDISSPLVPSSPLKLLARFKARELIRNWEITFGIDISEELTAIEEISLFLCKTSGIEFFAPACAEGSPALYESLQNFDWFYMKSKWEFKEALSDLRGCKQILEVGAGPGHFVQMAMGTLKGASLLGLEQNQFALQTAQRKGLPIEPSELGDLIKAGNAFDGICAFQVMEHFSDPLAFLENVVDLLSLRGKLVLCLPNRESFLRYEYNLLDLPPHHMSRWNVHALKYLERIVPLRLLKIAFEPLAAYHVSGFLSSYGYHFRNRLGLGRNLITDKSIACAGAFIKKCRIHKILRGQSLYAVYEKL